MIIDNNIVEVVCDDGLQKVLNCDWRHFFVVVVGLVVNGMEIGFCVLKICC